MAKRISKPITNKEDIEMILNLKTEDITKTLLVELIGDFDGKSKYNPYDILNVPTNRYRNNKKPFTTTLGLWIWNILFIYDDAMFNAVGYVNTIIDSKKGEAISLKISSTIIEDRLTGEHVNRYMRNVQFIMGLATLICPSYSEDMLLISNTISKKKKELLKKYDKEIKAGDAKVSGEIEEELISYCKEILKDDPAADVFNSGARGSFHNNFKNLYVMRGATKDPDPNKGYNIITSSYMDGITKEEYAALANSLVAGPYARGKKTEVGGHWEKLYLSAYQHITLDKPGSDCGTKRYITVTLDNKNISEFMYSYIIENGKLILIDSTTFEKYINKTVKMRYSSMCEGKKSLCNKCAGELFYKMGVENIGVTIPQIASRIKLISMKSFHDSQVNFAEMNVMKAFGIEE